MSRYRRIFVGLLLVLVLVAISKLRTMHYDRLELEAVVVEMSDLVKLEVEGPYLELPSPHSLCDGEAFSHHGYWVRCYINAYDQSVLERLSLDYIEQVGISLYRSRDDATRNDNSRVGYAKVHFDRRGTVVSTSY